MAKTVFLHFGVHKTGTTSIQAYLKNEKELFHSFGYHVLGNVKYDTEYGYSFVKNTNCFQIAHALIREDLNTIMRIKKSAIRPEISLSREIAAKLNHTLLDIPQDTVVISSESFSFLRTKQEKSVFDQMFAGLDLFPIGFFRSKSDWMRSWKSQVDKSGVLEIYDPCTGQDTFDFTETSWLLDHDDIRRFFGPRGRYLSYDDAVAQDGSVIPAFLRALDLDPAAMPTWQDIWQNRSSA